MPVAVVFLVVFATLAWLVVRRANQLCELRVEGGRCRLAAGRAPPALVDEVDDIVKRAGVETATFRIVVESGEPRLLSNPAVSDAVIQRIRNCVGQYRIGRFRTGKRP